MTHSTKSTDLCDDVSVINRAASETSICAQKKTKDLRDVEKEIGKKLEILRSESGKSVEEIASLLKVSSKTILAIEQGEFEKLTDRVFAIGLIRGFAKYINFDPSNLIASIKDHYGVVNPPLDNLSYTSKTFSRKSVASNILGRKGRRTRPFVLIAFLLSFFLIFCFFKFDWKKEIFLNTAKKDKTLSSGNTTMIVSGLTDAKHRFPLRESIFDDWSSENNNFDDKEKTVSTVHNSELNSVLLNKDDNTSQSVNRVDNFNYQKKVVDRDNNNVIIKIETINDVWIEVKQTDGKIVFVGSIPRDSVKELICSKPIHVLVKNPDGISSFFVDGKKFDLDKNLSFSKKQSNHFTIK